MDDREPLQHQIYPLHPSSSVLVPPTDFPTSLVNNKLLYYHYYCSEEISLLLYDDLCLYLYLYLFLYYYCDHRHPFYRHTEEDEMNEDVHNLNQAVVAVVGMWVEVVGDRKIVRLGLLEGWEAVPSHSRAAASFGDRPSLLTLNLTGRPFE